MIPQPVVGSLDLPRPHRIPFQRRMTFIARIRPMKGKKGKAKGKGKKGKAGQRGLVVFFSLQTCSENSDHFRSYGTVLKQHYNRLPDRCYYWKPYVFPHVISYPWEHLPNCFLCWWVVDPFAIIYSLQCHTLPVLALKPPHFFIGI